MPKEVKKDKVKYRITNWKDYNKALVNRGSLTFWFSEDVIGAWQCKETNKTKGRPKIYSDDAIICALTLRELFHLPLRSLQGFISSLIFLLQLNLPTPCYTQISRRSAVLNNVKKFFKKGAKHIVFDSSGLKVYGEGEWKVKQHGTCKKRTWRKIHLGIDSDTQEIVLCQMTTNHQADATTAEKMLDEVEESIEKIFGDGSYDTAKFRKKAWNKGAQSVVPPQRNATYKGAKDPWLRQRDLDVAAITYLGADKEARALWKKLIGYHKRSLVETAFARLKRLFGPHLKARFYDNQSVECQIKCLILNRMVNLGMPKAEPILPLVA